MFVANTEEVDLERTEGRPLGIQIRSFRYVSLCTCKCYPKGCACDGCVCVCMCVCVCVYVCVCVCVCVCVERERPTVLPLSGGIRVFCVCVCLHFFSVSLFVFTRRRPGVYVKHLVPGSKAEECSRLHVGDRILEANGFDLRHSNVDDAASFISVCVCVY